MSGRAGQGANVVAFNVRSLSQRNDNGSRELEHIIFYVH